MENKSINEFRAPICISVAGLNLNVFRVGPSPHINSSDLSNGDNRMKGTHTHFTFEVFFITSGKLTLVTDTETTEYDKCVLIIPPKLKHFSLPSGGESYCLLISFNGDNEIEKRLKSGICELPITEEVAFYVKKLTEKSLSNTAFAEADVMHLASLIFNNVLSNLKTLNVKIYNKKKRLSAHVNAIESFVNNNICGKITLSAVAKNVFLSPKQVSRIIKKEFGCSFSALITEKRLAIATAMLKKTDMKITEIANQVFFGSETYFYSLFKEKFGVSPLKYRKEIRIRDKYPSGNDTL